MDTIKFFTYPCFTTENRGISYDPDAVDACLKLFREKGFKLEGRTDNW